MSRRGAQPISTLQRDRWRNKPEAGWMHRADPQPAQAAARAARYLPSSIYYLAVSHNQTSKPPSPLKAAPGTQYTCTPGPCAECAIRNRL